MDTPNQPKRAKRARRLLQFSLRGLLLLIAICSVWLGIAFHRAREQARIVAMIQSKSGGFVLYDFNELQGGAKDPDAASTIPTWLLDAFGVDFFHNVTRVNLPEATDDELAELVALKAIGEITLPQAAISNEGIDSLKRMPELWRLNIDSHDLDYRAIAVMSQLPTLRWLDIARANLNDQILDVFERSTNLEVLAFEDVPLSTQAVMRLGKSLPNCTIYLYRVDKEFAVGPEAPPPREE